MWEGSQGFWSGFWAVFYLAKCYLMHHGTLGCGNESHVHNTWRLCPLLLGLGGLVGWLHMDVAQWIQSMKEMIVSVVCGVLSCTWFPQLITRTTRSVKILTVWALRRSSILPHPFLTGGFSPNSFLFQPNPPVVSALQRILMISTSQDSTDTPFSSSCTSPTSPHLHHSKSTITPNHNSHWSYATTINTPSLSSSPQTRSSNRQPSP
jgi:hypothetical protein